MTGDRAELLLSFQAAALDRATERRKDDAWIAGALADPRSLLLPLAEGPKVPLLGDGGLAWRPLAEAADHGALIFLGLDSEERALFSMAAAEASEDPTFVPLREAGVALSDVEAAAALEAVALASWHRRNRYCPSCGRETEVTDAGHVRRCSGCETSHFPRMDPAVIMLVSDGERAVLGRRRGAATNRWSTLAGYVEPGESPESAVVREVYEEAGILVDAVTYRGAQPWPFPQSLMLAFSAEAKAAPLRVSDEHDEVRWFSRSEVADWLDSGQMAIPGPISAGSFLIRSWLAGSI